MKSNKEVFYDLVKSLAKVRKLEQKLYRADEDAEFSVTVVWCGGDDPQITMFKGIELLDLDDINVVSRDSKAYPYEVVGRIGDIKVTQLCHDYQEGHELFLKYKSRKEEENEVD